MKEEIQSLRAELEQIVSRQSNSRPLESSVSSLITAGDIYIDSWYWILFIGGRSWCTEVGVEETKCY